MLRPVHNEQPTPEALYIGISKAAAGAVRNVKEFTALMRDAKSQEILAKSRESNDSDTDGVVGWLVSQHADWLDNPSPVIKEQQEDKSDTVIPKNEHAVGENVSQDLASFKDAH